MTAVGAWMKTNDAGREVRRLGSGEWAGIGWTDSSWELARGLDVVEDVSPDAWPAEFSLSVVPLSAQPQKS
jgi:hypothetical protein